MLFAYADEETKAQRGEITFQGHLNKAVVEFGYKILSPHSISVSPIMSLPKKLHEIQVFFPVVSGSPPMLSSLSFYVREKKNKSSMPSDSLTSGNFSLVLIEQRSNMSTAYLVRLAD